MTRPVCLILSGGGARGFAHIGALRAIQEFQIPVGKIIGSSMGAVIGGLYAVTQNVDEIEHIAFEFCKNLDLYLDLRRGIRLKSPHLPSFFTKIYQGKTHASLKIPIGIVAANFETAQAELIEEGYLAESILASISVPFLNSPYAINGNLYFDSGLTHNFPLDFYDKKAGRLVGINVGAYGISSRKQKVSFFEKVIKQNDIHFLVDACLQVSRKRETEIGAPLQKHGVILDLVPALDAYSSLDFKEFQEIIGIGYRETIKQKERILRSLL